MMICNIQHFIPQIPSGIHYVGFHCSARFVETELKGFLPRLTIENTEKVIHAAELQRNMSMLLTGCINWEMFTDDHQDLDETKRNTDTHIVHIY